MRKAEVCINHGKVTLASASLAFISQVTKRTTAIWPIFLENRLGKVNAFKY